MNLETPRTLAPLALLLAISLTVSLIGASGCASESWEGPCRDDDDCLFSGADVGKVCKEGLCEFSSGVGTSAPNFCLPVINPASEFFGNNRCLAEEKGQVVLLFFGLIA